MSPSSDIRSVEITQEQVDARSLKEVPTVPKALVEFLLALYPVTPIQLDTPERQLWLTAGQQSIAVMLKEAWERQNNARM